MTERVMRMLNFDKRLLLLVVGSMALVPSVLSQASAAPSRSEPPAAATNVSVPTFDVVSVKPNNSDSGRIRIMNKPDGYSATNVSLKILIEGAYGIREYLISGEPGWANSARYDIDAKVAGADVDALKKLSPEQRNSMLLPLLADRFKLKVHTETKQLPVFELVVAKGGPKMKEATPDDTYAGGIKGPDGVARGGMVRMGRGQLTAQGIPIATLVNMLSRQLQRTVIDKTGLTGKYDVALNWTPEEGENGGPPPQPAGSQPHAVPLPDDSGPSISTALQEQLGLKLQPAKGPVETLVIDYVEKPSEN